MGHIVWLALALGAGAAMSVGPVFVAIVQSAVTCGFPAGMRVILGSALADLLLVVPALAFTWILVALARGLAWIGLIGAALACLLAAQAARGAWRLWRGEAASGPAAGWALRKGLLGNLASPATWSFWLAVGTPTMLRAHRLGGAAGLALFLATWFATASGIEAAMAFAVSRSGRLAGPRTLAGLNAGAAVFFLLLAGMLVQRGVSPRLAGL